MLIKSIDVLRQLVRGLRTISVVAAFALTSTAYADPLYLFTLTFNHAPIDIPYGGQISSLSWTLPYPAESFNPVGPGITDEPNFLAESQCSGGYCPYFDKDPGFLMDPYFTDPSAQNPTPTGKFGFGWGFGAYGVEADEIGPTVFRGPIQSPVFIPGTYVMTSGTVNVTFVSAFDYPIDPNFEYDLVTNPTAGDVLTITREGDMSPIPEPSSFCLSAIGLLGIALSAKKLSN